jgi:FMN phosphatase YigB (HAD superfamily)
MSPVVDSVVPMRKSPAVQVAATLRAVGAVSAPDVGERDEPAIAPVSGLPEPGGLLDGVEAIVFEPAGVLYDATLWWRWLLQLLARLNPASPTERFERCWQNEYLPTVQTGRRELAEALEACLAESGYPRSQIDELTVAATSRRRELELEVRPLPGVTAALGRLRQSGFRLALSCDSTSPPEELGGRLARYHLEQSFEVVLSSIELGRIKPDLLAFQAIESRLRLTGERLLFAGCRAGDLAGAAACGWATLLVGPGNIPGPWPRPHVHVSRLADLVREIRAARKTAGNRTSS